MRKLNSLVFYSLLIFICLIITLILVALIPFKIEPGDGQLQIVEFTEKIHMEILSKNYLKGTEFLMRAKIDGKQIGIIYFDENGDIQFDGDRERFEYALCKVFKIKGWIKEKK